jgi:uncharacterized membrane protein
MKIRNRRAKIMTQPQQPQSPPPPQQPQQPQNPQTTGLQENVAGMLCYVFWLFSGIALLVLEPNNKNIKFHAFQSIIISVPIFVLAIIFSSIHAVWFIGLILWVGGWVLLLYLALMTYQGSLTPARWHRNGWSSRRRPVSRPRPNNNQTPVKI